MSILLPRKNATVRLADWTECVYLGHNAPLDTVWIKEIGPGRVGLERGIYGQEMRGHQVLKPPPGCACDLLLDTCGQCKDLPDEVLP